MVGYALTLEIVKTFPDSGFQNYLAKWFVSRGRSTSQACLVLDHCFGEETLSGRAAATAGTHALCDEGTDLFAPQDFLASGCPVFRSC
jgi:hypothetical protein